MFIRTNTVAQKDPAQYEPALVKPDVYERLVPVLRELDENMAEVRERLDRMSPDAWWAFHEYMLIRDTHGSLALEDYKMDVNDVSMQYKIAFVAGIPPETRKAIEGLLSASFLLHRISERGVRSEEGTKLTKDLALNTHTVLYGRIDPKKAGLFRDGYVRRPEYPGSFPPPSELNKRMDAIFNRISESTDHPVVKAFFTEYALWSQQPFWDGNSRTSRLLRDLLLAEEGYLQTPVPENFRGLYEKHRVQTALGKPEGFYRFMISMLEREINLTRDFLEMPRRGGTGTKNEKQEQGSDEQDYSR